MFERFLTRLVCVLFVLALWLATANKAKADLYYNTYQGTGAYPTFPGNGGTLTYSTPRSSGTVTRIYHNWGSGAVLNSGLAERVIVNYYGYITIPTAGTYTFYNASDDGFYMKIDGAVVINDWQEQGTNYYNGSGSKTFASAGTYAIDVWYYENGGGAAAMLFWNQTGSIQAVPTDYYTTVEPTVEDPDPDKTTFSYYSSHQTRKNSFDSIDPGTENSVRIEQVGDNLDITITQNKESYSDRGNKIAGRTETDETAYIVGDHNTIALTQLGNNNVMNLDMNGDHNIMTGIQIGEGHRSRSIIEGNYNDLYFYQSNTGGEGNFVDHYIVGNSNSVSTYQYDNNQLLVIDNVANNNSITAYQRTGENYGSVVIRNDGHTVGLDQKGGGDHAVDVNLSGYSTTVTITQDSATSRSAEVHNTCTNSGGCTVTVNQQ